ncbi:MAG: hypothetical protein ACXVXY_03655 [Mycobacteriaceae bacterium]
MAVDPSATPSVPGDISTDPVLGPLLADPSIQALLSGSSTAAAKPLTTSQLIGALLGSSMDVMGRYGSTGHDFKGVLPPWAQNLSPQILDNPNFDPYLGVVSQQGDERVFMGDKTIKVPSPVSARDMTNAPAPVVGDPETYMNKGVGTPIHEKSKTKHEDKTLTSTQAMNLPYTWDDAEVKDVMKKMQESGIPVDSFDTGSTSLVSVWGTLVNRAAMTYSMSEGQKKVTPWDVLDMYKSEAQAAGTYTNYVGYGDRTTTTVNRSVSTITDGEAWSVMQQTLSRMLGRDPSDQELRDYTYRMNQMAAANPSISKTITRYKNGEAVGSSTHTDTGFTASDMAQNAYDNAQSNPEYGAYQAASTYFNAALSALGPIGG